MFSLLGDHLKNLGKFMINASPIIKGIKLALENLNPAALLIGGIALVAVGQLIKTSIPKFREGTMTTGQMVGVLGDNPSGREYVIPSESIDRLAHEIGSHMGGGGSMEVFGRIETDGDKLVTIIERAERRRGRTY